MRRTASVHSLSFVFKVYTNFIRQVLPYTLQQQQQTKTFILLPCTRTGESRPTSKGRKIVEGETKIELIEKKKARKDT